MAIEVIINNVDQEIFEADLMLSQYGVWSIDRVKKQRCKSAETMGGSPMSLFLYVPDADATFKQAVAAGASVFMPVMDMFWGDRAGSLTDPFGYQWMVATKKHDYTKEEIRKNAEVFFTQMAKK